MKIVVDGFEFDFQDAISALVFDERERTSSTYHGLSHAMKAVDIIVELADDYLFVEVKDFHEPEEYQNRNYFNHLRDVLKYKYRDSFLYRWAEQKTDKPINYLCLLTLDNALISRMNKEMRIHKQAIINFRVDRSNRNPTNFRNQCRGEPYVRPPNNNRLRTYVRGKRF